MTRCIERSVLHYTGESVRFDSKDYRHAGVLCIIPWIVVISGTANSEADHPLTRDFYCLDARRCSENSIKS